MTWNNYSECRQKSLAIKAIWEKIIDIEARQNEPT